MSRSRWASAHGRALAAVAGAGLVAATLSTAAPAVAAPPQDTGPDLTAGRYIITFDAPPAATYTGGEPGYEATKPEHGKKINPRSANVRKYQQHLEKKHDAALDAVGADAYYDYSLVLNGVAADLTAEQARTLSKDPQVKALTPRKLSKPTTNASPELLGLPKGLWPAAGGQENAGAGVVVGVIDTGIWPESPSFAPNDTPVPADWKGECVDGEKFDGDEACNGKIIGARYYVEGFGADNVAEEDYFSPRDGDGHGSHTASTAAGNPVDDVVVDGNSLGDLSGMAPGAKIAAYKVCWAGKQDDGCSNDDSVAAIEQAVADGVDVINYSIGSTSESPVYDSVELAFLNAASAGVFVAASAGNSGPGSSTLDHPSPWLTTVAASTHKISEKKLVLGDGQEFIGASTTDALPDQTPMVLASQSGAEGVDEDQAAICNTDTLDPAKVEGKLVVCERRGIIARIDKSFEVQRAGGAGMVLINTAPNSLNGDLHAVPSVHVGNDALEPVTTYVSGNEAPTGAILPLEPGESDTQVPEIADFSSRGPSTTTGGDILKPDISAPGVDVAAAVAPPFNNGREYDLLSGTSMASPHIAGLAAVLIGIHPDWSPMAVKSALMTTAIDNVSTDNPFDQGAGFVQPNSAVDPGIVFDSGPVEWIGYVEQAVGADLVDGIEPIEGNQVNQPSVAEGDLAGTVTLERTVTNVGDKTERYSVSADLPGTKVTVSPAAFTVPKGQSRTVSITITRTDAAFGKWTTGSMTFTGKRGHVARIPMAVRPVAAAVDPAEVRGDAPEGSGVVNVTSGFTGEMTSSVTGLVGVTPEEGTFPTGNHAGAFDYAAPKDPEPGTSDSVWSTEVDVTDATTLLRMSADAADDADLDLWVYRVSDSGAQQLVAYSAGPAGQDEQVTMADPRPGTYVAYLHGFDVPTDGSYTWAQWLLGSGDEGNLAVSPASQQVTTGQTVPFTVSWSGLDTAQRYLGWVGFYDGGTLAGRTIVSVN